MSRGQSFAKVPIILFNIYLHHKNLFNELIKFFLLIALVL